MSGYRRFVAYVYEYQKGKKGRNCGFIRVEAKEQICRMEAHILCPGLTPRVKCEIFGFTRKTGLLDGVLLGSCITEESRADCVLETEREHMGGSTMTLENMGGMILLTENGAFFGTEWDDKPIRPENFRRVKAEGIGNKREDKEMNPQNSTMHSGTSEESPEEMKSEDEHIFMETKSEGEMQKNPVESNHSCQKMHNPEAVTEEVQESKREEKNAGLKDVDSETEIVEGQQKAQSEEKNTCVDPENLEKNICQTPENTEKKTSGEIQKNKLREQNSRNSENDLKQDVMETERQRIPSERHPQKTEAEKEAHTSEKPGTEYLRSQAVPACNQGMSGVKEKPLSFGDPIDAFGDGEIFDCRKIQPADLCHFHPGECGLRNNRFLQYGFYNFGHLLIGKNCSGHYILGVPGGYDQQERFMANMFGFPYFKESRQIQLPKSRGGYWYRLINSPKFY